MEGFRVSRKSAGKNLTIHEDPTGRKFQGFFFWEGECLCTFQSWETFQPWEINENESLAKTKRVAVGQ